MVKQDVIIIDVKNHVTRKYTLHEIADTADMIPIEEQ